MPAQGFDLADGTALLARTPRVLDAWLRGLPPTWLACDEGPETWSPHGVVGHLIEGERTDWLPRVRHIFAHGERVAFPPFDRFAQERAEPRSIDALLDELAVLRKRNLDELASLRLSPDDLRRRGQHPEFGTVTLEQHLATWVAHDLTHVAQIARVMAKRHATAVGPWRAYLRVVRE